MISLSSAAQHSIEKALIKFGNKASYVIYPFGQDGKILKGILNYEYNIEEKAIIDNVLAERITEIDDISYLKEHEDAIVFIASSRTDLFDEIRKPLNGVVDSDRCIEVYEDVILGDNGYDYYSEMLRLTQIYETDFEFVRIGNPHDGGYVMVDNLSGGIAYSFGISDDPSWDLDMRKYGYEVFMYDHTVECPAVVKQYPNELHFFKKGIADSVRTDALGTLSDFLIKNGHIDAKNLILKMDVEGAEWGFLEMVPSNLLDIFSQIVFEFHGLNTKSVVQREKIIAGLNKLFLTHRVVHIHANNYGGFFSFKNHVFPDTLEVTYLHKELARDSKDNVHLPINLDAPCWIGHDEIILGNWNAKFPPRDSFNFFLKCFDRYYRNYQDNDIIYVLGDSHVGFFSGNDGDNYFRDDGIGICRPNLQAFRVFHLGPVLAYNLNKYGTGTKSREKFDFIFDNLIPKGSKILLSFGEIDIRVHVMKHADNTNDYQKVVDEIVEHYVSFIKEICGDYTVYVWGPVGSQDDEGPIDKSFPRCGTQIERNKATKYFTTKMEEKCSENHVAEFLSAFSLLVDDNLKTKKEYYKDPVHLSQHAWRIIEPLFEEKGIIGNKRLL